MQHLALAYDDLAAAVAALRTSGVSFFPVHTHHLDRSYARVAHRPLPWDVLRREGILVDADEQGLLFQLFTDPVAGLGGFFFELLHRDGATGFGAGNVRALFAAVDAATGVRAAGTTSRPTWTDALVRAARERIPFYRDHLAGSEGADFSAVPSFDKSMTRPHGRFPMSAGGAAGAHRVLATSGTSGDRLYVSLDEQEWRRTANWLEMVGRGAGMSADDALLNAHCYGLWVGGPALDLLANRCGAGLVPLGPVAPRQVVDLLAQGVGTAISATPSYVRRMVEAAEAAGVDLRRTRLRVGFIGAEPAESSIRHKLLARLPKASPGSSSTG